MARRVQLSQERDEIILIRSDLLISNEMTKDQIMGPDLNFDLITMNKALVVHHFNAVLLAYS